MEGSTSWPGREWVKWDLWNRAGWSWKLLVMIFPARERRVLIAAGKLGLVELGCLFGRYGAPEMRGWMALEAGTFEQARFVLQHDPCEVLLLDSSLYEQADRDDLRWLAGRDRPPIVLLADARAETIHEALEQGVSYWLPRELARERPGVLQAFLEQAAELGELRRQARHAGEALQDSRLQVNRLVGLLWQSVPGEGPSPWHSQRYLLERLHEEVARVQRHGGPLSVILAEMEYHARRPSNGEALQLTTWVREQLGPRRRRSDVAGQYGPAGFLMILPHSDDAAAAGCCRRLRALLERPQAPSPFHPLQVCFGIASYSSALSSSKSLLCRAEERLEQAQSRTRSLQPV